MRRTRITALAVLLLAALALLAAGCGGSSKNAAATTEAATTEATTTEAATTEEATTEEATTEEAATTEATSTTALGGIASSGNCKELQDLSTKLSSVFSSSNPNAADIKKEAEVLNEFADKAPSEIKAEFKTVAAFVDKVADIYGNVKPGQVPDAATLQKLQGLQGDAQKVSAAGQKIAAWAQKNCHA
jgi:ABC-type glycerol-3-phosphate transport system substrate-binding protein